MIDVRSLRPHLAAGLLALLTLIAPERAQAQFVLYYAVHGDWTVTCAREMLSQQVACTMFAPPPNLGAANPPATITINENRNAPPAVVVRLPGGADVRRPAMALIDAGAPIPIELSRFGEGGWRGNTASSLIETLRLGNSMSIAWTAEVDGQPRTTEFPLASFDEALADYRQRLASYGMAIQR